MPEQDKPTPQWEVVFAPTALEQLSHLDEETRAQIMEAIEELKKDPFKRARPLSNNPLAWLRLYYRRFQWWRHRNA